MLFKSRGEVEVWIVAIFSVLKVKRDFLNVNVNLKEKKTEFEIALLINPKIKGKNKIFIFTSGMFF